MNEKEAIEARLEILFQKKMALYDGTVFDHARWKKLERYSKEMHELEMKLKK